MSHKNEDIYQIFSLRNYKERLELADFGKAAVFYGLS